MKPLHWYTLMVKSKGRFSYEEIIEIILDGNMLFLYFE